MVVDAQRDRAQAIERAQVGAPAAAFELGVAGFAREPDDLVPVIDRKQRMHRGTYSTTNGRVKHDRKGAVAVRAILLVLTGTGGAATGDAPQPRGQSERDPGDAFTKWGGEGAQQDGKSAHSCQHQRFVDRPLAFV